MKGRIDLRDGFQRHPHSALELRLSRSWHHENPAGPGFGVVAGRRPTKGCLPGNTIFNKKIAPPSKMSIEKFFPGIPGGLAGMQKSPIPKFFPFRAQHNSGVSTGSRNPGLKVFEYPLGIHIYLIFIYKLYYSAWPIFGSNSWLELDIFFKKCDFQPFFIDF